MTVINTNVGALMARTYAATSAQELKLPWNVCRQVCALMVQLMMPLVWLLLIKCRASLRVSKWHSELSGWHLSCPDC